MSHYDALVRMAPAFCRYYAGYTWEELLSLPAEVYEVMVAYMKAS